MAVSYHKPRRPTNNFPRPGTLLAEHFPRRTDDKDELPDAVERD